MKCTSKEWDNCRVEKMGCSGCYYNDDSLEEAIKRCKIIITTKFNNDYSIEKNF